MTRKELRQTLLGYRKALPESSFRWINQVIMRRLAMLPEIRNAGNIHCFWPISERRELDTSFLIRQFDAEKKRVVLPVIQNFASSPSSITPQDPASHDTAAFEKAAPDINAAGDRMVHWIFEGETKMVANRWGILEPASQKPFPVDQLDAVIVPALGVDRQGNRLGYGKGFYDAFLARCDCPFICPLISKCLLDEIPAMPHDIPVDIIVTEHEVIRLPADTP